MTKHKSTYLKIKALSEQGATPGEREAARLALERFEQKYSDLPVDEIPTSETFVRYSEAWQRFLIVHIAEYLDLRASRVRNSPSGRWRKGVLIEGPEHMIELAASLYDSHKSILPGKIEFFVYGYCFSAMPSQAKGDKAEPEDLDIMVAGAKSGINHRVNTKQLRSGYND